MNTFHDFPKLECPFEKDEDYKIFPKVRDEYRWVFSKESIAVVKIDGTNVSLWVRNGRPYAIINRTNEIDIWKKGSFRFLVGVINAIERNYFKPSILADGGYFGELIGPKVQGNPYHLEDPLWVPFSYLLEKYKYKFWDTFIEDEVEGKSDEEILGSVDTLFKGLWCIYKRAKGLENKYELGSVANVNEDSKFHTSMAAEGIVFYRKGHENDFTKCCKLRRDNFDWYKGKEHGTRKEKE